MIYMKVIYEKHLAKERKHAATNYYMICDSESANIVSYSRSHFDKYVCCDNALPPFARNLRLWSYVKLIQA